MNYLHTITNPIEAMPLMKDILLELNSITPLSQMTVLEIGVGNGNKSISLATLFQTYYGIEPSSKTFKYFTEMCDKYNSTIKGYNMNLQEFVHYIHKVKPDLQFDLIILMNTIHFIGINKLLLQINGIITNNTIILIKNPLITPRRWGDSELNEDSDDFNPDKWLAYKNKLEECYDEIIHHSCLCNNMQDKHFKYFVLKNKGTGKETSKKCV